VAMKARLARPSFSRHLCVKHGIVAAAAYCQQVNVQSFERKSWVAINLYSAQNPPIGPCFLGQ